MSLLDAIYKSDVQGARRALEQGAKVRETGEDGVLPLVEAARSGRADMVSLLLDAGADVKARDENEESALGVACWGGHVDVVALLLEHGADPNETSPGSNPLTQATAQKGATRLPLVKLLLDKGADPNGVLHSLRGDAMCSVLMRAAEQSRGDVLEWLLQAGARVNDAYFFGSPLSSAVKARNVDAVRLLLAHGANPDFRLAQDDRLGKEAGKSIRELAKGSKAIITLLTAAH